MIPNSATEVPARGDFVNGAMGAASHSVSEISAAGEPISMAGRANPVRLTSAQRHLLESWVRAGTTPQRVARRARIVLLADEGLSARRIARRLGVSPNTVALWRRMFQKKGPSVLLRDAPGRGRKATVARQASARLRTLLDTQPPGGGRWTIRGIAEATGISRASVHRALRAEGLAPANRSDKSGTTATSRRQRRRR